MIYFVEENCEHSIPSNFLSNLTETLLATFNNGSFSEHQINQALDRYVTPFSTPLTVVAGRYRFPSNVIFSSPKAIILHNKNRARKFCKKPFD